VLSGLEVDHRPVQPRWLDPESPLPALLDSTSEISLAASVNTFAVEMSAVHFGDARSVRFGYMLHGFDGTWIETDAEHRVATYTRLAPGDYELRARARTRNGVKSAEEARLLVHVLPPWWRTSPALVGWALAGILAAYGVAAEVRRRTRVHVALMERETLRKASLTDALTGLYNRRFLAGHLEHEVPATLRAGDRDLLFFLLDLDRFKAINDEHGHAAGDRVLATVAQTLKGAIRESDLAVRWGGDEFLVVSRSFERRSAPAAAERLRRAVEGLGLACTLSVGWAAFPFLESDARALSWEQTLELADRALLVTKRRGRNRCAGLAARAGTPKEALLAYLAAGAEAPRPDGITLVESEDRP
jgi:diguanylate cyclase (GGDEF)-like protein